MSKSIALKWYFFFQISESTFKLIYWIDFKINALFPKFMSDLFHAKLRTFRAQYLSAIEAGKVVNLLPTIMKGHLQKHTEEQ